VGHTMGFPKANRKKTGFEHWQEGLDQEQTSATDDHAVLQADPAKLARCASPNCLSSLSLTSAPAVHFPTFSAVCICLTLLHPRESPDKAHPSSPKIEVIGRHRIYCVNRQAPSPLIHGYLLHASTKTLSHVSAAPPI
jgi:hypothetical protein